MYSFTKEDFKCDSKKLLRNDVTMSNGLGGYTSLSITNSSFRKHHGYLIASLKSPVERYLFLKKIVEIVEINNEVFYLETQKFQNFCRNGYEYLEKFEYGNFPVFYYQIGNVKIKKSLSPIYNSNAVAVYYEIESDSDCKVIINPLFNDKEHGEVNTVEDLDLPISFIEDGVVIQTKKKKQPVYFFCDSGNVLKTEKEITPCMYCDFDAENGDGRFEISVSLFKYEIEVKPHIKKVVNIVCSLKEEESKNAFLEIKKYNEYINSIVDHAGYQDDFLRTLVRTSDNFICYRESTNGYTILAGLPWFTDWGRDSMIALPGITLVTKRYDIALSILKSFARYEENGLIPNMFPDDNNPPMYNTVDASLWYFIAVYKYVKYTNRIEDIKQIYIVLRNIIYSYIKGTDFSICMSNDGLIRAGSDCDQVTWMDVRIDNYCVTPRHGHPVEINALWYNALMIMAEFSVAFKDSSLDYACLAAKVKKSFKKFIMPDGSLMDVYKPNDTSVRPNQLFAYSLPFKVLEVEEARKSFEIVEKELFREFGIRSLSINDERFKPKYEGLLMDRDMAYHMGTTWCYLIGPYIDALCYVDNYSEKSKSKAKQILENFEVIMLDSNLGGIPEIIDGNGSFISKGCYNQAWSVAEVLRAYKENVLSKKGD